MSWLLSIFTTKPRKTACCDLTNDSFTICKTNTYLKIPRKYRIDDYIIKTYAINNQFVISRSNRHTFDLSTLTCTDEITYYKVLLVASTYLITMIVSLIPAKICIYYFETHTFEHMMNIYVESGIFTNKYEQYDAFTITSTNNANEFIFMYTQHVSTINRTFARVNKYSNKWLINDNSDYSGLFINSHKLYCSTIRSSLCGIPGNSIYLSEININTNEKYTLSKNINEYTHIYSINNYIVMNDTNQVHIYKHSLQNFLCTIIFDQINEFTPSIKILHITCKKTENIYGIIVNPYREVRSIFRFNISTKKLYIYKTHRNDLYLKYLSVEASRFKTITIFNRRRHQDFIINYASLHKKCVLQPPLHKIFAQVIKDELYERTSN